jgi:hypothetical protein
MKPPKTTTRLCAAFALLVGCGAVSKSGGDSTQEQCFAYYQRTFDCTYSGHPEYPDGKIGGDLEQRQEQECWQLVDTPGGYTLTEPDWTDEQRTTWRRQVACLDRAGALCEAWCGRPGQDCWDAASGDYVSAETATGRDLDACLRG